MGLEVLGLGQNSGMGSCKEICNGSRILEKCEREFRNGVRIPGKVSKGVPQWG